MIILTRKHTTLQFLNCGAPLELRPALVLHLEHLGSVPSDRVVIRRPGLAPPPSVGLPPTSWIPLSPGFKLDVFTIAGGGWVSKWGTGRAGRMLDDTQRAWRTSHTSLSFLNRQTGHGSQIERGQSHILT